MTLLSVCAVAPAEGYILIRPFMILIDVSTVMFRQLCVRACVCVSFYSVSHGQRIQVRELRILIYNDSITPLFARVIVCTEVVTNVIALSL